MTRKKQLKQLSALLLVGLLAAGLTGCSGSATETENGAISEETVQRESNGAEDAEETAASAQAERESEQSIETQEEEEERTPKQVVVYFANWNLNEKEAAKGGEVASIPWDSVTYINHAFWAVAPADGSAETSFERRAEGKEARTEFKIVSTSEETDLKDTAPSAIDPSMERNHFAQYAALSERYPDVNVMISVGGWTACGYFSEMAYTQEGRASFIQSCLDLMEEYPWIDGIDLDWEYPGGSNDGERLPESENDQGCPIWGSPKQDRDNFAALVKEMREAFTLKYGEGVKKITACASSSTGWTLPNQDWVAAEPYVDLINIMTYDMAGDWDKVTGHASGIQGVKGAVSYFLSRDIPKAKLNIGAPLYGTGFMMSGDINPKKIVGASIEPSSIPGDSLTMDVIKEYEAEAVSGYRIEETDGRLTVGESWEETKDDAACGWHFAYDEKAAGAYLYNDDEASDYYKWYISYENPLSLQEKLDLIEKYNLAGIIVWECSEDTEDHAMIRQMSDALLTQKE